MLLAKHWVDLKLSAWAVLKAESLAGWNNPSPLVPRFKEEPQKSVKKKKKKVKKEEECKNSLREF